MNLERGNHELSDLRYQPDAASGVTEWKGDIFLEDEQSATDYMWRCAVWPQPGPPQSVEHKLPVYDVVSGMLVSRILFQFYGACI